MAVVLAGAVESSFPVHLLCADPDLPHFSSWSDLCCTSQPSLSLPCLGSVTGSGPPPSPEDVSETLDLHSALSCSLLHS